MTVKFHAVHTFECFQMTVKFHAVNTFECLQMGTQLQVLPTLSVDNLFNRTRMRNTTYHDALDTCLCPFQKSPPLN